MLKRWAAECVAEANKPRHNAEQRDRLIKMSEALLQLVQTQDWLDRRPPATPEPTHSGNSDKIEQENG